MLKRILFVFVVLGVCAPFAAFAQTLSLKGGGQRPMLLLPQEKGVAYAIFKRLDDLWIVSDSAETPLNIEGVNHHLLLEKEQLYVPNGQGVRLGFDALANVNVKKVDDHFEIYLNTPSEAIKPLEATLFEEKGQTKLKASLGGGQMRRVTSFVTGESYLVLTTYLNRGQAEIRTQGAVRQLKAQVGAVFVSSKGLPISFGVEGGVFTFKPMQDALSQAVTYSRYRVPPSLVEELLDQLNKTQQKIASRPERIKTGFDVLLPELSGLEEATYSEALKQMQAALDRISALQQRDGAVQGTAIIPQVVLNALDELTPIEPNTTDHGQGSSPQENGPILTDEHGEKIAQEPASHTVFINFGNLPVGEYSRVERKLKDEWVFAKTRESKQKAGERLAAYYLFRGLYPEALGVLGNLGVADATMRTLKGAANVLLGRFSEAANITQEAATADEALWHAAALNQVEPAKAAALFGENMATIKLYPPTLAQALRYYYAAALREENALPEALTQLDQIALLEGGSTFLAKAQLLMARIYEAQERLDQAEQIYIALASHHDKEVANFALLYFMNLLTQERQLTPQDAIVRYENLRFLWRGDMVEEESLFRLADLYAQVANYRLALERLQSLVTHFPESIHSSAAAERMAKVFEGVIMGHLEDPHLDTLGFLALYYDFRELTPAGQAGDDLVARVADKLSALGLYQRATDILEKQRTFRITDPQAVALLGYKLAQIYAKSFAPDKGLAVLQKTERAGVPASLNFKRALVKAVLLALAEKPGQAFDVVKNIQTPEGQQAQAFYGWEIGNMEGVVQALDHQFQSAGGMRWSQEEATKFLALTSALSAQRKYRRLEELYNNYRPGLEEHGLQDDVLFFLQAANKFAEAPIGAQFVKQGGTFWAEAAKAMDEQNAFNRKYYMLKKRWSGENALVRASEEKSLEEELRGIR